MTDLNQPESAPRLKRIRRALMGREIETAALANSGMQEIAPMMYRFPEWSHYSDEHLTLVHSMRHSKGLRVGFLNSMRSILSEGLPSDELRGEFLTDMTNHLDAFWKCAEDHIDDETLPYYIVQLGAYREWLTEGDVLTHEEELKFLLIMMFLPSYSGTTHYGEALQFIRSRNVEEAATALRLRASETVMRFSEAESVLDSGIIPLATGAL